MLHGGRITRSTHHLIKGIISGIPWVSYCIVCFRLVSHSMRTEGLVNKCLRSVVDRLKEGLVRSPRETFLTWDGSVMAQLTQVLTSLPDNPHVYHQLSLLVVATLELAWSTSDQVQVGDIYIYISCSNTRYITATINNYFQIKSI